MSAEQFKTERTYGHPQVIQFSIFLDNRVGRLGELVSRMKSADVHVAALSVVDSVDFAIVRCVLAPSSAARRLLAEAGLPANETELVIVEMPDPDGLTELCDALIKAEVNIHHLYPLIIRPHVSTALAVHVDEPSLATQVLLNSGFELLGENDLI